MIQKIKLQAKRLSYRLKRDYFNLNNIVVAVAFFVALSWAWGSIESMQHNYQLQRTVYTKKQQAEIAQLQVSLLGYEARYFESSEYLDLAVRQRLGLANPGEKQLIVPSTDTTNPNTPATTAQSSDQLRTQNNFQQWLDLLIRPVDKNLR